MEYKGKHTCILLLLFSIQNKNKNNDYNNNEKCRIKFKWLMELLNNNDSRIIKKMEII